MTHHVIRGRFARCTRDEEASAPNSPSFTHAPALHLSSAALNAGCPALTSMFFLCRPFSYNFLFTLTPTVIMPAQTLSPVIKPPRRSLRRPRLVLSSRLVILHLRATPMMRLTPHRHWSVTSVIRVFAPFGMMYKADHIRSTLPICIRIVGRVSRWTQKVQFHYGVSFPRSRRSSLQPKVICVLIHHISIECRPCLIQSEPNFNRNRESKCVSDTAGVICCSGHKRSAVVSHREVCRVAFETMF